VRKIIILFAFFGLFAFESQCTMNRYIKVLLAEENREVVVFMPANPTVLDIKMRIQKYEGIPVADQQFYAICKVFDNTIPGAIWPVDLKIIMGNKVSIQQIIQQDGGYKFKVVSKKSEFK